MSMRQVLDTVEAMLKDDAVGLRANLDRLVSNVIGPIGNPNPPSSDFDFVRWALPGTALRTTTRGNVMLRPRQWQATLKYGNLRVSTTVIDIGFETFAASPEDIETEVALVATALAQCFDTLRTYSDGNKGTIEAVQDPLIYNFGAFEGPTSNGFVATATITEMSSVD